jgi:hypothetical protein
VPALLYINTFFTFSCNLSSGASEHTIPLPFLQHSTSHTVHISISLSHLNTRTQSHTKIQLSCSKSTRKAYKELAVLSCYEKFVLGTPKSEREQHTRNKEDCGLCNPHVSSGRLTRSSQNKMRRVHWHSLTYWVTVSKNIVNKLRRTYNAAAVVIVLWLLLLLRMTCNRGISNCRGRLSIVSKEFWWTIFRQQIIVYEVRTWI